LESDKLADFNHSRGKNRSHEKMNKNINANKINLRRSKSKATTIALIAIMTIATLMAFLPVSQADLVTRPTHAYVTLSANPIGMGQTEVVTFRIEELNPLSSGVFVTEVWRGFTVKITNPQGNTETKGPFNADTTGGSYFTFVPTSAGNYTLQAFFPGQWVNGSFTTVANTGSWSNVTGQPLKSAQWWFAPSQSPIVTLNVQEKPIPSYPDNPLPAGYWTRPIYGENKGWSAIADNWLMRGYDTLNRPFQNGAAYARYTSAPQSPHILWNQPITFGGVGGGKFGDKVYYTGLSYETYYEQLILNGRIYYQDHGPVTSVDTFGTNVLDLYTGKQLFYINNSKIDVAQVLDFESPNEHGLLALLWSLQGSTTNGSWIMYDAFTGRQILTVVNVTSGSDSANAASTVFGPNGELLSYSITGTGANRRMILWNSTLAIEGYANAYFSPRVGSVVDGRKGIQWNVSIPQMSYDPAIITIGEDYILTEGYDKSGYPFVFTDAAFPATLQMDASGNYPTSLQPLWIQNRTDIYSGFYRIPRNIDNGVYVLFDEANIQYHGYSIKNGQQLWVTDPLSTSGWSLFTYVTIQAYGMFYEAGFDGHIRAFNTATGAKVWDFYMGPAGTETPYGEWPSRAGFTVADGKIYATNDEHTPDAVMWRGGKLYCLDAYTGQQQWNISGWMRMPAISDGILTAVNSYDNQIYTIGKGPSATTIQGPLTAVPLGTSVTLVGKVTDQSEGQKNTPAISDKDMGAWMEYLHMQKTLPVNAKGVDVTVSIVDPNGNSYVLGNATSDISGSYGYSWKPTMEGTYQITATFAGTNSYGSSYDMTYLTVGPATAQPSAAPTQTPTPAPTATPTAPPSSITPTPSATTAPQPGTDYTSAIYVGAAAVVVIIVVAVIAIFMRKRK
jgi:hypothetical protein